MRPVREDRCAPDRRLRRARLLQQLPLGRSRAQRGRPAARGDAALRLADHARRPTGTSCRRAARWRSIASAFSEAVTAAVHSHPNITHRARGDRRAAAGRVAQRHRRDRAADLPCPRRGDPGADRRGCAGVLRRHRADRPRGVDRPRHRLGAVALRQGRAGRHRRRLPQLPDGRGAVQPLRRCAADGDAARVQGVGERALFRRLPADRGDGGARARDAAARADEAGGAHQSAQPDGEALRHRPAAAGQCAGHAVEHGRVPDQDALRHPGRDLPA